MKQKINENSYIKEKIYLFYFQYMKINNFLIMKFILKKVKSGIVCVASSLVLRNANLLNILFEVLNSHMVDPGQ